MSTLYLDIETYNIKDISIGPYRYAETAEILLLAYAFGDAPVNVWDVKQERFPDDLKCWLHDDQVLLTAHNALFDRIVIKYALNLQPRLKRWRCTMAKAYSHALPGSLEACGAALGLAASKTKQANGQQLINRFCKPAPKNREIERYDHTTHPNEWEEFKYYAAMDVEAMREIDKRLPSWNWKQKDIALYHLDQRINDRGFFVDRELTEAGARTANIDKKRMADEFQALTKGVLERPTQREKFKTYLNQKFDLDLENTRAETLRGILANEKSLDADCQRLMEISILSNKTSTSKYATLAPAISFDGRFRGGLQFRGAARTRRWAGRTFQPQNLPSRGLPAQRSIDNYIRALKVNMHEILFDDLMLYSSATLRGVVTAPKQRKLAVADLSNIEGRVLAWLAGETWKIKAFFDYDAGKGPDLYNITATSILGGDPNKVVKTTRNIFGKIPDLAFGYEGGYGACQTFAKAYGISFYDHWSTIIQNVDPKLIADAKANWVNWGRQQNPDADKNEWVASEVVKLAWRSRHPKSQQLWKSCQEAAKKAIQTPGKSFRAGPWLRFAVKHHSGHSYLLCRLPSGNFLCYFAPRYHTQIDAITYMGVDNKTSGAATRKWRRMHTYGGKIVENACQSLAMDIMAENMQAIDENGFPIILTVHDEIISETKSEKPVAELTKLMTQTPNWLPDFPLAASGFDCTRYKKE